VSAADGLVATLAIDRAPLDAVRIEVAHVSAEGSALASSERTVDVGGLASGTLPFPAGSLAVTAGARRQGGSVVPVAAATLSGGASGAPWSVSAEVGGRAPTAIERVAAPLEIAGSGDGAPLARGNRDLEPEVAFVLRADHARLNVLSGVGASAEIVRVAGPIVLEGDGGEWVRPVNADDEVAAAASLWAAVGDSANAGGRATVDLFRTDEDGAVVSLEPTPLASVAASAWLTSRFFEGGFLEVRWEISLRHESGLSRGPWDGIVDDGATSLDACVSAQAGPVRLFVEIRDVLDGARSRVPDRPPEGRRVAAGFSTSLWN
jgi:hypothetical protein